MKRVLLLILCLAIPLQGFAAVGMLEPPCPMEIPVVGETADGASLHDCCNDADTFAKTGKSCKMDQKCPAGGQYLVFPPAALALAPTAAQRFPPIGLFHPPVTPTALWRPPTPL